MSIYHLYMDDSGSRYSDRPQAQRNDGMDYFALGGILIDEGALGEVYENHRQLSHTWGLGGPLHSAKIRGCRGAFSWLSKDPVQRNAFLADLQSFVLDTPMVSIACVIDRPGYVARYSEKHPEPWLLCQTAFAILVERACKFAMGKQARLKIFFEESGKKEDRALMGYMKSLKADGMPFPGSAAAGYESLTAHDFRSLVLGSPNRVTKRVPMVQIADLVLYAIAKGGYDKEYGPFKQLHSSMRIIDAYLLEEQISSLGVKYSCFDTRKARENPSL